MTTAPQLADELLTRLADEAAQLRFPGATYRLQLHASFTFNNATELVPYLHDLGITHCYASPYLKARPGSQHGYDIADHRQLNPEIGSEEDHDAWVRALHSRQMGLILDTVPNHMGILGNQNPWWNDVLENGPASTYARFFDISWEAAPRPELRGRLLLPILGDPYGKALEAQQIRVDYSAGCFTIRYFDHLLPVEPCSYDLILGQRLSTLEEQLGADSPEFVEYQSIRTAISHLPSRSATDPAEVAERLREKEVIKRRLATLTEQAPAVRRFIDETLTRLNGKRGDPRSFDTLDALLAKQVYRLAYWRVAAEEVNYRRFFDIHELAALSQERPEVFEATHQLILRLLREGKVDGLRIDHIDGLYDPREYLQRLQQHFVLARARALYDARPEYQAVEWQEVETVLRERLGRPASTSPLSRPLYVVIEKILGPDEVLPADWPVYGTSGYEFLNQVNGLFIDRANEQAFTRLYHEFSGLHASFADVLYFKKRLILQVLLAGELHMLTYQLDRLAQKHRYSRDFTFNSLRAALQEVIACFPVYRSYITGDDISATDRRHVLLAVGRAKQRNPALSSALFDFVRDMLLLRYPESASEADRSEQRRFTGKFQQVTAPVMAKGLEDTACYVYNRLLSLNEVGGAPDRFGVEPGEVHRFFQERQAHWPHALSTLSTHDTKRSEDVRARLNVLSELPQEWEQALARWSSLNAPHRVQVEELLAPDANEEYLIYQTLLGAWPLEPYTAVEYQHFVSRMQAYLIKALHEAKVHTSWINPNPAYDEAVQQFVARIVDEAQSREFLNDFRQLQRRLSHYGLFNSLAQTLLKITAPGVPDIYQGMELWDFSLVDPDNRRPVDYGQRQRLLAELRSRSNTSARRELARELVRTRNDGRIKLYVTSTALQCRRDHPELFAAGEYLPALAAGSRQEHVFAFVRHRPGQQAVVAVPRLLTRLCAENEVPMGPSVWGDTNLALPGLAIGARLENVFTGEVLTVSGRRGEPTLPVAELLSDFPVALLLSQGRFPKSSLAPAAEERRRG